MYEAFYGFRDNPFRLTPDPDYLFLSASHQEALGHLLFGVSEGSGVVVITGEIGAGKTTLLRTLVRSLDAHTTVAYIFNPALSALELLQTINADLGTLSTSASKKELIDALNRFLLEQQHAGRRVVVIIDEAQNLEPGVLEQLRLLSNLETEREKLLQIILVGQPELGEILARRELAQLNQRVTLRWHLGPLTRDDTAAYVRHRLRVAADGRDSVTFSLPALRQAYQFSGGIPRLINILCHRALLVGYTREERHISAAIVQQAEKELRHHRRTPTTRLPRQPWLIRLAWAAALLLMAGSFSAVALERGWLPAWAFYAQEGPPPVVPPGLRGEPGAEVAPVQWDSASSPELPPLTLFPAASLAPASPPAVPSPAEQTGAAEEAFFQGLRELTLVESARRAADGLLATWEVAKLRPNEWQRGTLNLSDVARARQLEYLPVSGNLNLLSLLDLPLILEIIEPGGQEVRMVLLQGLAGDRGRVVLDGDRELPLRVLGDNWLGKAHLFWKDFEHIGPHVAVGAEGQQVKRLRSLLTKVRGLQTPGAAKASNAAVFDHETEVQIARFQRSKRLTPDGVVGPLTLILLYNGSPGYGHPRLTTPDAQRTSPLAPEVNGPATRMTGGLTPPAKEGT